MTRHLTKRERRQLERLEAIARPQSPILAVIDELNSRESEGVHWLLKAGPIARRLNAEAEREMAGKQFGGNHG